jgi:chromosome segregation ATPase
MESLPNNLTWLNLRSMNNEPGLSLEEKLARLQGNLNQFQTEKLKMQSEIDILTKEKTILMNALEKYNDLEETMESLRTRNIQLESQLISLIGSIEKIEQGL